MSLFLYFLFFIAGAASGFFWYKRRLVHNHYAVQENKNTKNSTELTPNAQKPDSLIQQINFVHESEFQDKGISDSTETQKKTIDNLYIVNELGRKVTSSLNLQQTFKHLYTTINSMMDAAVLELNVQNEITGVTKVFSNLENENEENKTYVNHMSEWCFVNHREVFLADAERDFARYVNQPLKLSDGRMAKSVIVFPVVNHIKKVSGTLCVISFQKNSFSDYHCEIIRLLLGYIAVAMDNAIRHEELNRTKIRAEQSEKFKEQFLANMSHEIRTPINAVTGMTRLLLEKQPRQDQLLYLESIRNASDSLLVIINDILDLSKIEAGKIELEKIDFSVFHVIKNVFEIMRFKAEEKGLILSELIDKNIPPVLIGDPTRLTQILINLIGNAVKFTEKGSVSVSVEMETTVGSNASLRFSVTDTGIGITEEQQSKLFQNYSQAGPETSRKYGGTGLGLSISRQLVERQGGVITVKSIPGKGSTFEFVLGFPVSSSKEIAIVEKSITGDKLQELKGKSILLADDNEYNRIVVRETLQLKIGNVAIDEATDGDEAIEMIRQKDYDLVLMDLVMPKMDGLEAMRYIRTMPSPKCDVPILALTASVVRSEMDKCFAAGMNGFIPKPFKNHELLGAIYKALIKSDEVFVEVPVVERESKYDGGYIDLNYLHEFTEGDVFRQQRYIDLFITKTPAAISSLKSALKLNDLDQLRITAHSMKSLLRFAGVFAGLELAENIEQNCIENRNIAELSDMIEKLSFICISAIEELKAKLEIK